MEELDDGDISSLTDEIALHGRGIDFDAKEWGKAALAYAPRLQSGGGLFISCIFSFHAV